MNEQNENYVRVGAIVVGVVFLTAIGWFLCRDIHSDSGSAADAGNKLESAAGKQRETEKSLESVQSGLDDILGRIGQLEQSNNAARESAGRIAESNRNIKEHIDDAQAVNCRGADILEDSERRITECQRILQDVSETAREN